MNHVKCGRCVRCGREYPAVPNLTNCECGGILDIIYDYDRIRTVLTRENAERPHGALQWRYRELLPGRAGDARAPAARRLVAAV